MRSRLVSCVAMLTLIAAFGCGPKPIANESVLDTAGNHFSRGMRALDGGNLSVAAEALGRAQMLDPDNGAAIAGVGLVHALRGDFKTANKMARDAAFKDPKSADVYLLTGRIITQEYRNDEKTDWIRDAVRAFDKAADLNPNSGSPHYYKGIAYERALRFRDAGNAFSRVVELKNGMETQANREYEKVQEIQRAAPGTRVGARVALLDEINRGEFAVLLMEELKLATILEKKRQKQYDTGFQTPEQDGNISKPVNPDQVPDIAGHWAGTWIRDIITARVTGLELGPDGKFHPDEAVTRAEFAMVMQSIVVLANGDKSITTRYIGQESRFPDVNKSHFAYNAIALMTERGILKAALMSGEFQPTGHISGARALLAIRQFQNEFKMTF